MSTAMQAQNANEAIEEMKQLLDVKTDGELADALGLQKTAVAQWRRRQSIPSHAMLRLQEARRLKLSALSDEGLEDAFAAVVGEHALMIACLLTPSQSDLEVSGLEAVTRELATSATWFPELRLSAALALTRRMKFDGVGIEAAFNSIILSPSRLAEIRTGALDD